MINTKLALGDSQLNLNKLGCTRIQLVRPSCNFRIDKRITFGLKLGFPQNVIHMKVANLKSCQGNEPYIPLACQSNSPIQETPSYPSGCTESTINTRHTTLTSNFPLGFTKISSESPLKMDHPGGSILTPNNPKQQQQQTQGITISQYQSQNLSKFLNQLGK